MRGTLPAEHHSATQLVLAADAPFAVQPQPVAEVKLNCWYMDSSDADQRLPHKQEPHAPASIEHIRDLGVVSWKLDADKHEDDPQLEAIRKVRVYMYTVPAAKCATHGRHAPGVCASNAVHVATPWSGHDCVADACAFVATFNEHRNAQQARCNAAMLRTSYL